MMIKRFKLLDSFNEFIHYSGHAHFSFGFSVNNSRVIIRISSAPSSGKGFNNTNSQQLYLNLEKAEICKNKCNLKMVLHIAHYTCTHQEALCTFILLFIPELVFPNGKKHCFYIAMRTIHLK